MLHPTVLRSRRITILSEAGPYWATVNTSELASFCRATMMHPLDCAAPYWDRLGPYWAALNPAELRCTFWATRYPNWASSLHKVLECRNAGLSGIQSGWYWNEKKCWCRKQFGTGIRRLRIVPVCSSTGLRWWTQFCRTGPPGYIGWQASTTTLCRSQLKYLPFRDYEFGYKLHKMTGRYDTPYVMVQ